MGTGCSTEVSQTLTYDKSQLKDDSEKVTRIRNQVRKHSTTSSSDVNVKVNKAKTWNQSEATPVIKGKSYIPDQSQPADKNSTEVTTRYSETSVTDIDTTNLSTATSLAPKIRDQWKLPLRLASLPRELQDLLLGHQSEPDILTIRPQVIHLMVIAPGEECFIERIALWTNAFMPLRVLCAEKGYVLDIQDNLWLSRNMERAYTHLLSGTESQATKTEHEDGDQELPVDALLVILTDCCNFRLPPVLSYEEYTLVVVSLPDSVITALFHDLYASNENRIPPAYELVYHVLIRQDETKLNRLVDLMMRVFEREQKDIHVFNSDYYNQILWVQQNKPVLSENIVVVFRSCHDILDEDTTCNQTSFTQDSTENSPFAIISKYFEKECLPEHCIKVENKKKDQDMTEKDVNDVLLKDITVSVKLRLEKLFISEIDKREECSREIATGVSRSLIEELVTQTKYHQKLTRIPGLLKSPTLISLQDYVNTVSEMPIVVYAEAGWGLSTLGAQLVKSCLDTMPTSVIIYRSMAISPDSRTLLSTLLSIKEQLDTILGPCTGTWCKSKVEKEQIVTVETLLSDIVSRGTKLMPLLIILEGISLASSQLKELDVMTMTELLPVCTKLLVMTSDPDVARGLRTKMRDAFYVKASHWDKESIITLFKTKMNINKRTLTDTQNTAVISAITHCPLPLYAITTAKLAASWRALKEIRDEDLPDSLEGIVNKLFEHLEHCIPSDCFSAMMAYLSISVGGISNWEMTDLLSINNTVLASIYSDVKEPPICRVPPILWKFITVYLRNNLNLFISKHFCIYSWSSTCFRKCAVGRYMNSSITSTILHKDISDYFMGRRENRVKANSIPENETEQLRDRFIANTYGKHLNIRKLMCLPFHLMNSKTKIASTLEKHIFNLPWIENKLNATSVLQVICDLEQARLMDTACTSEIRVMQQVLLQSSSILKFQGREVYKCLKHFMDRTPETTENECKSQARSSNGLIHFFAWLSSPPGSFLYPLDHVNVSFSQISNTSASCPSIDTIIPVSNDVFEVHVVAALRSQREIRVINIVTNKIVRTLTGIDLPQNLLMLDTTKAVVLCNRELSVIDLDKGKFLIKLRGVLNLRMPFFGLQNDQKVVALSRDRMVVNILDINTGSIVATFKALTIVDWNSKDIYKLIIKSPFLAFSISQQRLIKFKSDATRYNYLLKYYKIREQEITRMVHQIQRRGMVC